MVAVAAIPPEIHADAQYPHSTEYRGQRRDRLKRATKVQERIRTKIGDNMWRMLQNSDQSFRHFLEQCSVTQTKTSDWREMVSGSQDTTLISLDFEYSWQNPFRKNPRRGYYITQIGMAYVGLEYLSRVSDARLDVITTRLFNKGHWGDASKNLRFDDCTPIVEHDIKDLLLDVFRKIALQMRRGTPHSMILVGQAVSDELPIMASLGLDNSEIVPLAGIIDNAGISKLVLDESNTLFELCKKLDIPSDAYKHWFHSAANDANLTLRALLILAAKGNEQTSVGTAGLQTNQML